MTRSVHALLALLAVVGTSAAVTSCNSPNCGKGTKQVQQADGTLSCEQIDYPAPLIQCDVDGGNAEIIGGKCVSHIKCDPATTGYDPVTGICVGTGGGNADCPVTCKPPGSGKICVTGNVYDFSTGMRVKKGDRTLRIGVYEPLAFLGNPNVDPIQETVDDNGCYAFPDITTPGSGLVAMAVQDPKGTTQTLELTGTGATVVSGKVYKVDVYLTPKTVVDGWKTQTGKDYEATGAYIAVYYDQPVPDPTNLRIENETKPAAGVKISDTGTVVTTGNYFDPNALTLSTTLMATGPFGGAALPGTGNITVYSGTGGTCAGGACKWEQHPGASTAHVLFIDRYHNCSLSPTAATCQ